ncbi:MAG TPA: S8 family serine peptidase, partial [Pilimelia sp.]|nr:S8 family serine peptidase [Pilimelia sp.]
NEAPAETLSSHDLELLAEAEAKGAPTVDLIVATDKGKTAEAAAGLVKLGAKVANRVDEVGYLRVRVPIGNVLKAARIPGIAAIDLDEVLRRPDPVETKGGKSAARAGRNGANQPAPAAPGADTPAVNPFMPTHETGAVAFKKDHPAWDGRGITIGVLDSGVDLDHPALQTTTTGERKIVDWVTATDPLFDGDGTWRAMLTDVSGPTFTVAGIPGTWTAPAGNYKFNRFAESITASSEPGGDVNRDGDTTDRFGVLYDPVTNDIWVDSNGNQDFTDEPKLRPYREKFQVGHFGVDNPATPVKERIPFVVEFREDVDVTPAGLPGTADFVNIGIVESAHGTHVAGITAANDMFGNADFDGAAPGAKIVSSRACSWGGGCTAAAMTDGVVELVTRRKVDVVNISIGGLPALNDANNARARLYDRLISDYGVQLFISAGNSGPGVNTVGDPSVASNVVSVGASISKDTWLYNYGSVVRRKNAMFNFSSRGPREDGGLKPNITAPGSAVSTTPTWQAGSSPVETGYTLPPGYGMFNGTSMSSPQAAGAAALLLSAARATGKAVTPAGLRRALVSSATPISGEPTYRQGHGMVNTPGAWRLLRGATVPTRDYVADAPVCTPISDFLATPDRGTGLYNRCGAADGGHRANEVKTYDITLTRTSGPDRALVHQLSWLGNDGTFSAPARVTLGLDQPATITVRAKPKAGVHSAILRVDDPATAVVDFELSAVVVAAQDVTAPAYRFRAEGNVDRNSFTSYFVNVPAGAAALQVNLSGIATGSHTRFIAINPWGVPVESTSSLVCYTNFSDAKTCNPQSRAYANPLPGVWEIEVESRRTSPSLENPFVLTARVQGAQVTPAVVELPSVQAGVPSPVTWTVKNTFGPVEVQGKGGPLGSAASKRPTIAHHAKQTYTVEVPAGASRLDVRIGNVSDLAADLDLTVFRNGVQVGQAADGDSEEAVSIANPAAGTYTIEIDGYAVPAGTTEYDYLDVFYAPALGTVTTTGAPVALAHGASTTISGTVTALSAPAEGRQLFGEMAVVTTEGATIGRGAVRIGAVTS